MHRTNQRIFTSKISFSNILYLIAIGTLFLITLIFAAR